MRKESSKEVVLDGLFNEKRDFTNFQIQLIRIQKNEEDEA
jgi:hypothetical protein